MHGIETSTIRFSKKSPTCSVCKEYGRAQSGPVAFLLHKAFDKARVKKMVALGIFLNTVCMILNDVFPLSAGHSEAREKQEFDLSPYVRHAQIRILKELA